MLFIFLVGRLAAGWKNLKGNLPDLVCGAVMSMMSDSSSEPVLCSS